jgi:hypothetical protein
MAHTKWSDIRDEHIERVGREEFEAGKEQMLAEARGWRLAEIRQPPAAAKSGDIAAAALVFDGERLGGLGRPR